MSAIATAVVGGAVISGIASKHAADKAAKSQKDATKAAQQGSAAELAFAKEKYNYDKDRFERIYGSIEENLGKFYGNLTAQEVAGQELAPLDKEFRQAKQNIATTIQQRGITRSGLATDTIAKLDVANAEKRAEILGNAKFKLADTQSGFIRGSAAPSGNNVANALHRSTQVNTNALQNEANIAQNNANSLWSSTGKLLSTGLNYAALHYNAVPNAVNAGGVIPGQSDLVSTSGAGTYDPTGTFAL